MNDDYDKFERWVHVLIFFISVAIATMIVLIGECKS